MRTLALLLSLTACSDIFGPDIPDGTILLSPPPAQYQAWWDVTEQCSGVRADFTEVEFRLLPDVETLPDSDAAANYYSRGHRIVLAEPFAHNGFVVRHEMLHALLARNGSGGHPKAFFESRCGGVVSCGQRCSEDVGPIPEVAYSAPIIDPNDVALTVHVTPGLVRSPPGDFGCMTIVVRARNVGHQASVMDLGRPRFFWSADGLGGGGGGGPSPPNDTVLLQPGDARHYAFDCPDILAQLEPNDYWLRGEWRGVRSEEVQLSVIP